MAITAAENLKQKLLQHLDNDNNVVNERGVLEAMTLWEAYPVTREILEVTRIGKYVNELRKKTTNKSLARRAKDLVRKWQSAPSAASIIDTTGLRSIIPVQPSASSTISCGVANGNFQQLGGVSSKTYSPTVSSNSDSLLKAKVKPLGSTASSSSSPVLSQLDKTDIRHKYSSSSPVPSQLDRTKLNHKPSSSSPVPSQLDRTSSDIRHKTSYNSLTDIRQKSSSSSPVASQLDRTSSDIRKSSSKSLLLPHRGTPSYTHESRGSPSLSGVDLKSAFSSANIAEDCQSVASSIASLTDAGSRSCSPSGFSAAVHRSGNQEKYRTGSSQRKRLRGDEDVVSGDVSAKKKVKVDASTTSSRENSHREVTGNGAFSKYTSEIPKRDLVPQTVNSKNISSPSLNGHRLDHKSNQLSNDNSNSSSSRNSEVLNGIHRSSSLSPMLPDRSAAPRPGPSKLRKVETTAELMNKLHASGELRLWRSETIERIASGQIAREKDNVGGPVVPAGALPRPHKSSRGLKQSIASPSLNALPPATPAGGLGKVKTEMVHKFLQMSIPASSLMTSSEPCEGDLTGLLSRLEHEPKPDEVITFETIADKQRQTNQQAKSKQDQHIKSDNISMVGLSAKTSVSRIGETSRHGIALQQDDELCEHSQRNLGRLDDLLPLYNPDDIDWSTTSDYECPAPEDRPPITDVDIDRLHNDSIVGVNGYYDYRGEWKDWASMLTLPSYEGSLLHILPYVNVDD